MKTNSQQPVKSLLRLENVSKRYISESNGSVEVLKSLNLAISRGQLVTLVSATGTGKTTLLNLIAGLCESDGGTVTPDSSLNLKKDLAYVFQHYTLPPWQTVLKNIAFGLQLRNISKSQREQRAMELIEQVGLTGFEKAYPHELSGGMRQRAAIAQALAIKPKLLLMDEPFGSLDDTTRTGLQTMLIDLHKQTHVTTLFVTHNIDEAIMLANRIIVLGGRPANIKADIAVNLPRPRHRTGSEFTELYMKIRNLTTPCEVKQ